MSRPHGSTAPAETLLPGLIDAHAHYTFDPTEGSIGTILRRSDAEIVLAAAGHAATALKAGVTTARGAGSLRNLEVALRDAIEAGDVPGPRIVTAGTAVGITGGHGYQFGLEADDPAGFVTVTRRVVRDGADVVKVIASEAAMLTTTGLAGNRMVSGGPELTLEELRAVVATASELGVKVMSHAQDAESVRRSAAAGVASVEHAWLADRPALEALAESGAFLVPTMVVVDVNRTLGGMTAAQRERQDMIERRQRASTETAIELGIPVATGTDTGEVGVTADMVWREIVLLHDHGASPMAAIKAATSAAAHLLGLDADLGTSKSGSSPISSSSTATRRSTFDASRRRPSSSAADRSSCNRDTTGSKDVISRPHHFLGPGFLMPSGDRPSADDGAEDGPRGSHGIYVASAPGRLPPEDSPTLASLPLPPGHLVRSQPQGGSRGDDPVIWISEPPISNIVEVWNWLARAFAGTGLWPLIMDTGFGIERMGDVLMDVPPSTGADPHTLLVRWWQQIVDGDNGAHAEAALAPFGRAFPGLAPHSPARPIGDDRALRRRYEGLSRARGGRAARRGA